MIGWFKYDVEFFMRLRASRDMSNAEFGACMALAEHYWKEPFVPFKPSVLAAITGQKSSYFRQTVGKIPGIFPIYGMFFFDQNSGNLACPFLDEQKKKMIETVEARRVAAGRRWASPDANAHAIADANAQNLAMQKEIEIKSKEETPLSPPVGGDMFGAKPEKPTTDPEAYDRLWKLWSVELGHLRKSGRKRCQGSHGEAIRKRVLGFVAKYGEQPIAESMRAYSRHLDANDSWAFAEMFSTFLGPKKMTFVGFLPTSEPAEPTPAVIDFEAEERKERELWEGLVANGYQGD